VTASLDDYEHALDAAVRHALGWLRTVGTRPVAATTDAAGVAAALGGPLPERGSAPAEVVERLAAEAEPGLTAMGSGRFFGWVTGGTLPAALAADWLVSTWDQNAATRIKSPAATGAEAVAAVWLLDLLGLPPGAGVGFVTGATMANFTGLAAARASVLARAGWDVHEDGLAGAPKVAVLVGAERHDTVDLVLRYLGLGRPTTVAADDQGRIRLDALAAALEGLPPGTPTILVLQAGNLHSGAFDPFREAVALAHARGAWVHVDGAFGLWAGASPRLQRLVAGADGADSWATDAHKTLNVPYDCGIGIVADPAALRAAFGMRASYLQTDGASEPFERVPELSRRARGIPVWAALAGLGHQGVAELVEGLAARAAAIAQGVAAIPGAVVLNDVVFTQVCVAFEDDERTAAVEAALLADGTTWMSGSFWRGRRVIRVSVSNWSTDEADVRASVDALRRAAAETA
jgi:glutamate/tyrosine decarboxylase-like PLP-dependent enzyme